MGQEIVTLQKQIDTFARNQKVMEDRQKKYKEHHKIIKSRDLIPRPKGRPGRSHGRGYRVTEAMGLSKKKEYFNYLKRTIRKLAKRRLDTSRTLTQQKNGLMVEEVVFQAQVECKIFRKYENAWPVRDLLAQYLRNRSRKEKIDAKKFELFETQHRGGKRKVEDTSVSDEESSNSDSSENVNGHVSDIDSSWSEMGDANEECDASLGGCSEGMHADSDGGSDEDPRLTKSKTTKTLARSSGEFY
ncbi:hypothetical protein EDC04DRAFT_2625965 [Pisolithus marmoratus]|nr:hypothetical protein EDC04DRAFT_2625965 [Pisolithus marmoratus]